MKIEEQEVDLLLDGGLISSRVLLLPIGSYLIKFAKFGSSASLNLRATI